MKKLLLYSSAATLVIVIIGLLFVYGVFDFSDGQAQLIGPTNSSNEVNTHNTIVNYVHDIGNLETDVFTIYTSLQSELQPKLNPESEPTIDMSGLSDIVEKVKNKEAALSSFIENHVFPINRLEIREVYFEEYKPAVETFINEATKVVETSEAKEEFEKAHQDYIEAHNAYVDVLNKKRNY